MQKFLLSSVLLLAVLTAGAQSPTVVTDATNCFVTHNFNTTNEGFSSPSIYSNPDDVTFNWDAVAGNEIETSGLSVRSASLISPVYLQSIAGSSTVGFRYDAPTGTEYRIRILSGTTSPPLEILATTSNGPIYTPLPALTGTICLLLTDADLIVGRLIRIEFTFRSNHPGDVIFDDMSQSAFTSPLPVTFEGFVARKNTDGTTKLLWNVGEEINVESYIVETSINGIAFKNAGTVRATGAAIYSFSLAEIPVQTMYYRVRNVDIGGASKYTNIIKMYVSNQALTKLEIYPVPASDQVNVQHNPSPAAARITLIAADGSIIKEVMPVANTYQTQIQIGTLPKGIYLLRYSDGKNNILTGKIIKN